MIENDIIIIGGGLAGLIAGIHLAKSGFSILIIEKNEFPKHKVCGEYISNEVLNYLKSLNLDIESLKPTHIDKLSFSLVSGKTIETILPLGGFGVSRYELDFYLYKEALKLGCKIIQETVENITFLNDAFTVVSNESSYKSKVAVGAFGKRSNLDTKFKRTFIQKTSNWLGVKAHYNCDFPDDLVGLHHFKGGYCGISKVENNLVNICYLSNYETFKKYKNIDEYQHKVVCENPNLKKIFEKATLKFEKPLTISQISFDKKECVENHILMIGDTAGLIHPLCGNGMAMAIHSAKLASETIIDYLKNIISREKMESNYTEKWKCNFKNRLKTGRLLGKLLQKENLAQLVMKILIIFPSLLSVIIKKTHGKPI
ncbi:FAD-dependent oxidoreductase [Flavobacterium sp. SUN052]|uniref:NAD(P)/FAD-dependent oxidoreductase n=1 Tax=Flavobacterium sp. SUN052 TaxID=3002441 RepID=UPI00237E6E4E|nr:FAD-dependent oxidoreductase [Flavobacterium sp. SUN052]MEC4005098.1 FAD-dependent oxidoreductase [Flavobacterium sp. SUN052]